ncbi:MAG: 50S ribosomal protein L19 [candidate division WOR-3 bacterium]
MAGKKKNNHPEVKEQGSTLTVPEPGDLVDVHLRITEGDKERIQIFRGTVIAVRGKGAGKTFTVRRVSRGIGIERIFPVNAPVIARIDIRHKSKVRRAKLYYLRTKTGREAALKERKSGEESGPPPMEK